MIAKMDTYRVIAYKRGYSIIPNGYDTVPWWWEMVWYSTRAEADKLCSSVNEN